MPDLLFLKPANPKIIVRDPVNRKALPADGAKVADNSYWQRRLKDGDVVKTKPVTSKKKD